MISIDVDKNLIRAHTIRAEMVSNMIASGLTSREQFEGVKVDPSEYLRLVSLASEALRLSPPK